jgi:hypothetical protein
MAEYLMGWKVSDNTEKNLRVADDRKGSDFDGIGSMMVGMLNLRGTELERN